MSFCHCPRLQASVPWIHFPLLLSPRREEALVSLGQDYWA